MQNTLPLPTFTHKKKKVLTNRAGWRTIMTQKNERIELQEGDGIDLKDVDLQSSQPNWPIKIDAARIFTLLIGAIREDRVRDRD